MKEGTGFDLGTFLLGASFAVIAALIILLFMPLKICPSGYTCEKIQNMSGGTWNSTIETSNASFTVHPMTPEERIQAEQDIRMQCVNNCLVFFDGLSPTYHTDNETEKIMVERAYAEADLKYHQCTEYC